MEVTARTESFSLGRRLSRGAVGVAEVEAAEEEREVRRPKHPIARGRGSTQKPH